MGLVDDDSIFEQDEEAEERLQQLSELGITGTPLERCVDRLGISLSDHSGSPEEKVAKGTTSEEYEKILAEFRYAGKATVNYHVITGISDFGFDAIRDTCFNEIPVRDEIEGEGTV
ncbi:hypothetical protein [Salinigranum sp. GCM10025319]|uniref:hypothetical protein n=1 Tax=Salinigranum sp. GCM10025319 TaxID=3252687 RepID=UPI00360EBD15